MSQPDANIGFTLTPDGRSRLVRALGEFEQGMPQVSAVLLDLAGRIVEHVRKPASVNLEAIAALAAGVHASTHTLAQSMGEEDYALLFEHEDDQQVYVWPLASRALFVVLLKNSSAVEALEAMMEGKFGKDMAALLGEAWQPMQSVPPPRIQPSSPPPELQERTRRLAAFVADLQVRHGGKFKEDVSLKLLRAREDLNRLAAAGNWDEASRLIDATKEWLAGI